jgi:hypothetical protein
MSPTAQTSPTIPCGPSATWDCRVGSNPSEARKRPSTKAKMTQAVRRNYRPGGASLKRLILMVRTHPSDQTLMIVPMLAEFWAEGRRRRGSEPRRSLLLALPQLARRRAASGICYNTDMHVLSPTRRGLRIRTRQVPANCDKNCRRHGSESWSLSSSLGLHGALLAAAHRPIACPHPTENSADEKQHRRLSQPEQWSCFSGSASLSRWSLS